MNTDPANVALKLLRDLIRDTADASDLLEAARDYAASVGDTATATALRIICERIEHAADEMSTAETLALEMEQRAAAPV